MQGVKNGVTPLGNEYFDNAAEEQNKAAEWLGYIFPVPLPYKRHQNKTRLWFQQNDDNQT